ncbi:MAG: GbsR/MarR family transcriptional regulator [Dehalococcoidia bacterium]
MNKNDGVTDEGARRFIEAVGLFFEDAGVPRIGGRLLGLLLLAERPLSLDEVARTLGVSRASVSTNSRLLIYAGMIERVGLPGDRRDYYQFRARGWEGSIEGDIKGTHAFLRIATEALTTLDPANAVARARLHEAVEFYSFVAEELTAMLERWRTRAALSVNGAAPTTSS